ncbi:hypothetical protein [Streptomyces lateritius]|uniref:hypothetical protein n=1 Tax=Streptomyces lateritius TaxID=67313 RepID=UPI00167A3C00|nr:hypothetical protein [Streptomyces lateritius]GGU05121.1 hypothetical protein GCM10010272_57800 [Streptomyces lateritius]
MLALRLVRGTHHLVLLRRLLVAAAAAGVGFLLLCTLGYAVGHPAHAAAASLRLLWCAIPLAATVYFAVAVARTDPSIRPRPGLSAIGLGPARLTALAAASTAVSCTLGSMLALLFYLHLRGDITGLPFDGAAAELLAADQPIPLAAALTLLAILPVVASTAAGLALRPRKTVTAERAEGAERPAPSGLPWGVALLAIGLAVETYAGQGGQGGAFPLPGRFEGSPGGVLAGWILTAVGLAMAGPGITHWCGRLLQTARPGAVRLLAGRVLMSESRRIGRPLGVVCAVVSGALAAGTVYGSGSGSGSPAGDFGPLSGLAAGLVVACTTATLLTAALEAKQCRARTTEALLRLGAPATVLRTAALMRAGVLLAVFLPLTWLVAELAAVPLRG